MTSIETVPEQVYLITALQLIQLNNLSRIKRTRLSIAES
jgi:hypothetical protein